MEGVLGVVLLFFLPLNNFRRGRGFGDTLPARPAPFFKLDRHEECARVPPVTSSPGLLLIRKRLVVSFSSQMLVLWRRLLASRFPVPRFTVVGGFAVFVQRE